MSPYSLSAVIHVSRSDKIQNWCEKDANYTLDSRQAIFS